MSINVENNIVIPSSFLFWLACGIHCVTQYPYPFAWWVELLLWSGFLAPFAALLLYAAREGGRYLHKD